MFYLIILLRFDFNDSVNYNNFCLKFFCFYNTINLYENITFNIYFWFYSNVVFYDILFKISLFYNYLINDCFYFLCFVLCIIKKLFSFPYLNIVC
jgi:hypothetical protein